jgi:hypothetical protein
VPCADLNQGELMYMSNFEAGSVNRLVRTGANDYAATLADAEKRLGSALWKVIDLERQAPGNHPDDGGPYLNELGSREAQIGHRTSAELVFKALRKFEDLPKPDWLQRIHEAELIINTFSRDLPHKDDASDQSRLIIRPKRPISADDQHGLSRNAPYILEPISPEGAPLPALDVETASLILGAIAAEYA